ncbi:hypothetical protein PRUPE_4G286500 [Prunus persica]|uniref:Uncharacterized protein n=1 Tax=Prunus persica TaxID=3760 RepID=A0A251PSK6_PRUPE|nr:hypothetical protein PRUPE_4G286500 [Prunus persica]
MSFPTFGKKNKKEEAVLTQLVSDSKGLFYVFWVFFSQLATKQSLISSTLSVCLSSSLNGLIKQ